VRVPKIRSLRANQRSRIPTLFANTKFIDLISKTPIKACLNQQKSRSTQHHEVAKNAGLAVHHKPSCCCRELRFPGGRTVPDLPPSDEYCDRRRRLPEIRLNIEPTLQMGETVDAVSEGDGGV
jgi:hypothetical protein